MSKAAIVIKAVPKANVDEFIKTAKKLKDQSTMGTVPGLQSAYAYVQEAASGDEVLFIDVAVFESAEKVKEAYDLATAKMASLGPEADPAKLGVKITKGLFSITKLF